MLNTANNTLQYASGSQTCSNRYPNQGSDYVLLPTNKKFSHFMWKISFAVIAHNTKQKCGLVLRYPSKNRIFPPGGNLPPDWEPLQYAVCYAVCVFSMQKKNNIKTLCMLHRSESV